MVSYHRLKNVFSSPAPIEVQENHVFTPKISLLIFSAKTSLISKQTNKNPKNKHKYLPAYEISLHTN